MLNAPVSSLFLLLLGCILAGCDSTQAHRARQYSAAYAALPEDARERSLDGVVQAGDSRQAVYVALGAPQQTQRLANEDGLVETHWIYAGKAIGEPSADGSQHYRTVNDLSWNHPFQKASRQHIHVVFIGETVNRVVTQEAGAPLNLINPTVTLPQDQSGTVTAQPVPAGS